jgi:uncharacterized protein
LAFYRNTQNTEGKPVCYPSKNNSYFVMSAQSGNRSSVLDELKDVLQRKFGIPTSNAAEAVALVRIDSILAKTGNTMGISIRDEKDLPILSAAHAAKADVFVTGDRELLGLKKIGTMVIVGPRGFWELLQRGREV